MNLNAIKSIYKFNQEAGLLKTGYSDSLESSFGIEESLEGFNLKWLIRDLNDDNLDDNTSPKDISRSIIASAMEATKTNIPDVDRFDKHLDIIVFAFGSLFKLGLTPQQAMRGLQVVANANMSKLKVGKDEHGKQCKPKDFISSEPLLKLILNERDQQC